MSGPANPFLDHAHHRPELVVEEAARLLRDAFGVEGRLRELESHQDRNYRVDAADGRRFVLKVARGGLGRAALEAENAAMLHVATAGLPFEVPVPQAAPDGSRIVRVRTSAGAEHDVRLVSWLEGEPMTVGYLPPSFLRAHGAMAAQIAIALEGFDHPALGRALQWDVRHAGAVVEALAPFAATPARRMLLEAAIGRAQAALAPLSKDLRVRTVHQDVTDVNTLARRDRSGRPVPGGLIDFGDLSRTWLAAELAVPVAADAFHALGAPLQAAREIAGGFLPLLPLTGTELAALWPMVVARAAAVAISGDQQQALDPDNAYVAGARDGEWATLEAVNAVPFALAEAVLREVAGLAPTVVFSVPEMVAPLLDGLTGDGLARAPILDLSTTSGALPSSAAGDRAQVAPVVASAGPLALGRWGEARLADAALDSMAEPASVHLGVDVFAPAGTLVRAPVAGVVRPRPDGLSIGASGFELHLVGVRAAVPVGARVAAGDLIGETAVPPDDDGLPARVHVQLVLAPGLDAPTRAIPSLAAAWQRLCPDPSALLGIGAGGAAAPPDDAPDLLVRRSRVLADVQVHYYEAPPRIERGWRHHLIDTRGRAYVDIINNVAVLGHSHPAVEAAVRGQLARLNTNSRFLYGIMVEFAEALAARFPPPLDTVLLVNTGSEANELALRLAHTAAGGQDVLCVRGAYHGWTSAADAITTSAIDNPRALGTRPAWVHTVEPPNTYRGLHRGPDAGTRYADDVRAVLARLAAEGRRPAAFIAEPLFGNAGGVVLPDGYLREVYAAVRAAGGLAIADEVQTGYSRLGHHQWAFQQQGVVPDIVTVAKAAGNGMAVGAVVTTRAIAEAFAAEGSFFSSVGGSPVACAAGVAVLETIDREGLRENAREVGGYLRAGLEGVAAAHPEIVGAVHGMGLYLGVELVRDRETLEPAGEEALAICERMLELGVIVQPTGDGDNVLKVKPPLCLDRRSADLVVAAMERTLREGW
jgi:4-aminobutyrate aminotransferase-like enzyme/Ser/Thr protein kinase RdoA (MazF antagonist)